MVAITGAAFGPPPSSSTDGNPGLRVPAIPFLDTAKTTWWAPSFSSVVEGITTVSEGRDGRDPEPSLRHGGNSI